MSNETTTRRIAIDIAVPAVRHAADCIDALLTDAELEALGEALTRLTREPTMRTLSSFSAHIGLGDDGTELRAVSIGAAANTRQAGARSSSSGKKFSGDRRQIATARNERTGEVRVGAPKIINGESDAFASRGIGLRSSQAGGLSVQEIHDLGWSVTWVYEDQAQEPSDPEVVEEDLIEVEEPQDPEVAQIEPGDVEEPEEDQPEVEEPEEDQPELAGEDLL